MFRPDGARAGGAEAGGAGAGGERAASDRYLEVVSLDKRYREHRVLDGLDFRVGEGELVSLLGPSGCGKSTLLRVVAGLVRADGGDVVVAGRNVTDVPAHRRNVSVVFQNYALFPHLSVADNVAFGLRARRIARAEIGPRVDASLALVRMDDHAARAVGALSGGQQQRVAVARALAVEPSLLLLDEPFSALDRKLRETMQVELKTLLRERGITAVFVTHDQDEALAVSDRIAVMNAGRIEQFDEPSALYARPASAFVMDFVGLSTRLAATATATGEGVTAVDGPFGRLRVPGAFVPGTPLTLGVRPELIEVVGDEVTDDSADRMTGGSIDRVTDGVIDEPGDGAARRARPDDGRNRIRIRVADVMCLGSRTLVHGVTGGDDRVVCERPGIDGRTDRGREITLAWRVADTLVYPAGGAHGVPPGAP